MTPPLNHILCVDDEEDILMVAKLALEAVGGFRVSLCHGSADAVSQAMSLKPDLVLLDVMMPVMDGPATMAKLREPGARPDEISALIDLGAAGVVSKPFDPMTLSGELRSLWKNHHERL